MTFKFWPPCWTIVLLCILYWVCLHEDNETCYVSIRRQIWQHILHSWPAKQKCQFHINSFSYVFSDTGQGGAAWNDGVRQRRKEVVVTNIQSSGKRRVAKARRILTVIEPGMVQKKIIHFLKKIPYLKKNSSSPGQKLVFTQKPVGKLASQGPQNNSLGGLKRKVYQAEGPENQLKRIRQHGIQDQLN